MELLKSLSKGFVRKPCASLKVTWSDTSAENTIVENIYSKNRAHITEQVVLSTGEEKPWAFTETLNPIDSVAKVDFCYAMPDVTDGEKYSGNYLVGWWGNGSDISDNNRYFQEPFPEIQIIFAPIPITKYEIRGYLNLEYPADFDVIFTYDNGNIYTDSVTDNTSVIYQKTLPEPLPNVTKINLQIKRWSCRGAFVKIIGFLTNLGKEYSGDDIIRINILEETEGAVGTIPVGNISCNTCDISLSNIDDNYFFGNTNSLLNTSAKMNRRIEPCLGFIDENGNENLLPKGVFWTETWNIQDMGTDASTSAVDRLGLLQNITYTVTEAVWNNTSLFDIAVDILTDLRDSYNAMYDLEFSIDDSLKDYIIPLAFFKSQSYFDVIKTIASASASFAYMDTPTAEEKEIARIRGNDRCNDILRIKPIEQFLSPEVENNALVEEVTQFDFISKTTNLDITDVVNIITVPFTQYEIVDGTPKEVEDLTQTVVVEDADSILEFGKRAFEYNDNNLVQTAFHANNIALRIRNAYSKTPYETEINMFGDVTRKLGDLLLIPEYQKHGVDTRGIYAVTKISTEYDGGIRQNVSCRKVSAAVIDTNIFDELNNSPEIIIDESGNKIELIDEKRER